MFRDLYYYIKIKLNNIVMIKNSIHINFGENNSSNNDSNTKNILNATDFCIICGSRNLKSKNDSISELFNFQKNEITCKNCNSNININPICRHCEYVANSLNDLYNHVHNKICFCNICKRNHYCKNINHEHVSCPYCKNKLPKIEKHDPFCTSCNARISEINSKCCNNCDYKAETIYELLQHKEKRDKQCRYCLRFCNCDTIKHSHINCVCGNLLPKLIKKNNPFCKKCGHKIFQ